MEDLSSTEQVDEVEGLSDTEQVDEMEGPSDTEQVDEVEGLSLDVIWRSSWMLSTLPTQPLPIPWSALKQHPPPLLFSIASSLTPQHSHISHTTLHVALF